MKDEDRDKDKEYAELIARRDFMTIFFIPVSVIILWIVIKIFGIENPIIMMFILNIMVCSFSFWFMKKNICPWCGNRFFLYRKDGTYDLIGFKIYTQTKCINCGQPKDEHK